MIKIMYEFEDNMETKARELIDHAKWKSAVKKMEQYLVNMEINDAIPQAEQIIYHNLRMKLAALISREGLIL